MSLLAALVEAYEEMPTAPPVGYSSEQIHFLISLHQDGRVARVIDLSGPDSFPPAASVTLVPASFKRPGKTPRPFFLWDNSNFCLGVSADTGRDCASRLAAFRAFHLEALANAEDSGLRAVRRFIERWVPEDFDRLALPDEMKDRNIAFALDEESHEGGIHQRPAAKALWERILTEREESSGLCLVKGQRGALARVHPAIKGVRAAQPAGASLVSFNLDAFTSFGRNQGDNAPISNAAAFAYTTTLNYLLDWRSGHRLQLADSATVFWASGPEALLAEAVFVRLVDGSKERPEANPEADKADYLVEKLRGGRCLAELAPTLSKSVRFHLLGLAPNGARLWPRFWARRDFGQMVANYQQFLKEIQLEGGPENSTPLRHYLAATDLHGRQDKVLPKLAGEWIDAIFSGAPFPMTLLSTLLMRLRADKSFETASALGFRVALLKGILVRNFGTPAEDLASLNRSNINRGYQLGRLFAAYERTRATASRRRIKEITTRNHYARASACPGLVFPLLQREAELHLSQVGARSARSKAALEATIADILTRLQRDPVPFPQFLDQEQQAFFAVGYYHQRSHFIGRGRKQEEEKERVYELAA